VDLVTKKAVSAHVERADVCAVEAAAVIGEAVVGIEIANAFLEKFGGDSQEEVHANFAAYQKRLSVL
jgi:chorismate synthase